MRWNARRRQRALPSCCANASPAARPRPVRASSNSRSPRELGVSRSPVREALLRLSEEGLVAILPYRGAIVVPLQRRRFVELTEFRLALERFALERLIERGDAAALAELRAHVDGTSPRVAYAQPRAHRRRRSRHAPRARRLGGQRACSIAPTKACSRKSGSTFGVTSARYGAPKNSPKSTMRCSMPSNAATFQRRARAARRPRPPRFRRGRERHGGGPPRRNFAEAQR